MTQKLAPDWLLFTEQFPQFMKTYRRLAREAWFQDEGWTAFIAHYREGIYMQVYKLHWCNHLHGGIHMELALNQQLLEKKKVYLEAVPNPRGFGWKPDTDINLRHVM